MFLPTADLERRKLHFFIGVYSPEKSTVSILKQLITFRCRPLLAVFCLLTSMWYKKTYRFRFQWWPFKTSTKHARKKFLSKVEGSFFHNHLLMLYPLLSKHPTFKFWTVWARNSSITSSTRNGYTDFYLLKVPLLKFSNSKGIFFKCHRLFFFCCRHARHKVKFL